MLYDIRQPCTDNTILSIYLTMSYTQEIKMKILLSADKKDTYVFASFKDRAEENLCTIC